MTSLWNNEKPSSGHFTRKNNEKTDHESDIIYHLTLRISIEMTQEKFRSYQQKKN